MVQRVFVVLPFSIENDVETGMELARKAEERIGCYCARIHLIKENRDALQCLSASILAMRVANTVIFTNDWQDYPECAMLYKIAEFYHMNILVLDAETKDKRELIPCPFCEEDEILFIAKEQTQYGKDFAVLYGSCGTSGPTTNSEQEAVNLWNERGAESK